LPSLDPWSIATGRGLAESTALVYKDRHPATTMPSPVAHHQEPSLSATRSAALWSALAASALGFALLYVVAFAGPQLIHDAAHDTRHSLNFPCH